MADKVHPSWAIAVGVGEQMAKDRQEAEKQTAKGVPYGKEHLEPMEMARRYMEAGPDLRARMLAGMRKDKGGMTQVKRLLDAINKGKTNKGLHPPQLRLPQ